MKQPRLPPHADEAARTVAVLAIVAREIRREMRRIRRRRPETMTFDEIMARMMPDMTASPRWFDAYAAENNPNFYPKFLSHVKPSGGEGGEHRPRPSPDKAPDKSIGRRTDCAAICAVSQDFFDRNVHRLMAEHDFPRPLPRAGQRKWDLSEVRFWSTGDDAAAALKHARAAHAKATAR